MIAFETGLRLKTVEQRITSLMKEIDEIRFFQDIEDLGHGSKNMWRGKGDIIVANVGYNDLSAAAAAVSEADARIDDMSMLRNPRQLLIAMRNSRHFKVALMTISPVVAN